VFSGYDFFITALVGLFVLSGSRQEETNARLLRTLDDRGVGELMRPFAQSVPDWTTVANFGPVAEPALLLGWDGTPTALLPPGAVFTVPPEAREHVQLRALGVPLAQLHHAPSYARATDVVAYGLPAIIDDADGKAVGLFGAEEIKIASGRDAVRARSAR
jgi:hypothetical protein